MKPPGAIWLRYFDSSSKLSQPLEKERASCRGRTDDRQVAKLLFWLKNPYFLDACKIRCNMGDMRSMVESYTVGKTVFITGYLERCLEGDFTNSDGG